MKKAFFLFVITILLGCMSIDLSAQDYDTPARTTVNAEFGGPGLIMSFNYDTRFSKSNQGLGMRLGVGGFMIGGSGLLSLPAQLNYLSGNRDHFFEVGAGATYCSSSNFFGNDGTENSVIGTLTLGYRYQPYKGGFTVRCGFSPIFGSNESDGAYFVPYLPYVSLGYAFPGKSK